MLRAFLPAQADSRFNVDEQSLKRAAAVRARLAATPAAPTTSPADRLLGASPTRAARDAYSAFLASITAALGSEILPAAELATYVDSVWDALASGPTPPAPLPAARASAGDELDYAPIAAALRPVFAVTLDAASAQGVYSGYTRLQAARTPPPGRGARAAPAAAARAQRSGSGGIGPKEWGADAGFLTAGEPIRRVDAVQRLCQLDSWPHQGAMLHRDASNGASPCTCVHRVPCARVPALY